MVVLRLGDSLKIVGNALHARYRTRHGMSPSVLLVVSPNLSIHGATRG